MDKTIEIVVAAAVLMMIAAVIFFLISSQTDVFSGTSDSQITRADCKLLDAQAENGDLSASKEYSKNDCDKVLGGSGSPRGSTDCSGLEDQEAFRRCVARN
jgi:hypothetical protein